MENPKPKKSLITTSFVFGCAVAAILTSGRQFTGVVVDLRISRANVVIFNLLYFCSDSKFIKKN